MCALFDDPLYLSFFLESERDLDLSLFTGDLDRDLRRLVGDLDLDLYLFSDFPLEESESDSDSLSDLSLKKNKKIKRNTTNEKIFNLFLNKHDTL